MQSQLTALIKHRPLKPSDMNFIYSSWLKSYRQSDWAKDISNDVFFTQHKEIIDNIIARPTTSVIVICNPNDDDQLYGFLVHEVAGSSAAVHFVYMKYNFRKLGIMKNLMGVYGYTTSTSPVFISHIPRNYETLKTRYNLVFSPYLLFI